MTAPAEATTRSRPRVTYISYDGMGEPLGRSQVLAYLYRLSADYKITLLSFEKPGTDVASLRRELASRGIDWKPLSYHKHPAVLSTALDVAVGVLLLWRLQRTSRPDIIHVRSYVPALIAVLARLAIGGKLIFDIRGFWPEERVEGGIWPAGGLMFRLAKRCESWFFQAADAVVTLTHASLPRIRRLMSSRDVPVVVIPTCVDLQRFSGSKTRADGPHLVWCGSIGTWYRFDLVPGLARALDWQLEVVTRQVDLAFDQLGELGANVRTLSPAEVPDVMCEGDVGLSLCKDVLAMQAMAPTRFAEYMASGMSVVVTPGLGDVERLVEEHRVGVILRGEDEAAFRNAAVAIRALQADPALPGRCLALARECFDVEAGTRAYAALYDHLLRRDR